MPYKFLVDPENITNFKLDRSDLELNLLFWICAAGKNGQTAAICLNNFLSWAWSITRSFKPNATPFEIVRFVDSVSSLPDQMRQSGIGNYTSKARSFNELSWGDMDLRKCTVEELDEVHGIGPKTARGFVLHTRPNQQYACLDRHVLTYLNDRGIKAPKNTPSGRRYLELEKEFLKLVKKSGKTAAEFDLFIWRKYRSKGKNEKKKKDKAPLSRSK